MKETKSEKASEHLSFSPNIDFRIHNSEKYGNDKIALLLKYQIYIMIKLNCRIKIFLFIII